MSTMGKKKIKLDSSQKNRKGEKNPAVLCVSYPAHSCRMWNVSWWLSNISQKNISTCHCIPLFPCRFCSVWWVTLGYKPHLEKSYIYGYYLLSLLKAVRWLICCYISSLLKQIWNLKMLAEALKLHVKWTVQFVSLVTHTHYNEQVWITWGWNSFLCKRQQNHTVWSENHCEVSQGC